MLRGRQRPPPRARRACRLFVRSAPPAPWEEEEEEEGRGMVLQGGDLRGGAPRHRPQCHPVPGPLLTRAAGQQLRAARLHGAAQPSPTRLGSMGDRGTCGGAEHPSPPLPRSDQSAPAEPPRPAPVSGAPLIPALRADPGRTAPAAPRAGGIQKEQNPALRCLTHHLAAALSPPPGAPGSPCAAPAVPPAPRGRASPASFVIDTKRGSLCFSCGPHWSRK